MTLSTRSLSVGAALLLAAPAAALADAPWSAPVDVGPPQDYVLSPSLGFAPGGGGLAGWNVRTSLGPERGRIAVLDRDGKPGRVVSLPDTLAAGPALDRRGRGIVLRTRGQRRQRLTWSAVSPGGRVGRAHRLATAVITTPPALAVNRRGAAVAAWTEYRRPRGHALYGRYRVRAAWRRPGGRFGRPVTLLRTDGIDSEHNGAVEVALGRRGRAVVTFANVRETRHGARRHLLAWTGTPRHGFGRALRVGPQAGFAQMAAAVSDRGRVVVAWGTQDGGEEANHPWVVRAATLGRHAHRFARPQVFDHGGGIERPMGQVALAMDGDGRATVAWSGVRGRFGQDLAFPVQVAESDRRGRFAQPQQLAASGAVGGVAVRPDGAAVVTWAHAVGYQITDQALAAVRPAGAAAFGAPEAIAPPDVATPPAVAFDPATGRPTAAWPARPGGVDPSRGVGTTAVLRFSTRVRP